MLASFIKHRLAFSAPAVLMAVATVGIESGVVTIKKMAVYAMGFSGLGVVVGAVLVRAIFKTAYYAQMLKFYTVPHLAQMVNLQAFGHRAVSHDPNEPVNRDRLWLWAQTQLLGNFLGHADSAIAPSGACARINHTLALRLRVPADSFAEVFGLRHGAEYSTGTVA